MLKANDFGQIGRRFDSDKRYQLFDDVFAMETKKHTELSIGNNIFK